MSNLDSWSRREFLPLSIVVGGSVFAGCLSRYGPTSGTSTTPPGSISTSPTTNNSHCAGYNPQEIGKMLVRYNTGFGFDLKTNKDSIQRGESLTVTLENITDTDQTTGNSSKYDIHRQTKDGWVSIFWPSQSTDATPAFHSDAVSHHPGEGFTWNLKLTQDALGHEIKNGTGYRAVCSAITAGTYRFVYWGLQGNKEGQSNSEGEQALVARFNIINN